VWKVHCTCHATNCGASKVFVDMEHSCDVSYAASAFIIIDWEDEWQSPFLEANNRLVSQEILCPLCNPYINFSLHSNPPLDTIMSQATSVHNLTLCFFQTRFNIILRSTFRSSLHVSHRNFVCTSRLFHAFYVSPPSYCPSFDNLNSIHEFSDLWKPRFRSPKSINRVINLYHSWHQSQGVRTIFKTQLTFSI
jgi:hypothetical protein